MSSYKAIRDVDATLHDLLWAALETDDTITGTSPILASEESIHFDPPFRLVQDGEPDQSCLNLFLYRIIENAEMKNRPLEPRAPNRLHYPPLSLNLFYLVTPLTRASGSPSVTWQNDHLLLGKVMQVFHDHAIVRDSDLRGELADHAEELRIILNPMSTEDMTKLWSALQRPYRLSASYEVKVVFLDSQRDLSSERVRRKRLEFAVKS